MKYKYTVEEKDFLSLQLFAASTSKNIKIKKLLGWIFLSAASGIFSIIIYRDGNILGASILGILTFVIAALYPALYKLRYKKHYTKYVNKHYHKRFGETASLEIFKDYIVSKNKTGEGRIKISEIDEIIETQDYLFMKISSGVSVIIPKESVNNIEALKSTLKDRKIKFTINLDWKW